jgi:N-acetylglucosaminyl-diphospho-decaprenol L-rhamnosyltransferase
VPPVDPNGDVSVAITTYKNFEVVQECLRSFEAHEPRRVGEVIVVDNSADDETPHADAEFPWIRYARNSSNVHFRRAVNQGARMAKLPYLLILNPDTYLTDGDSIAKLAEVLDTDPSVALVGPKIRGDDGRLAPQGERLPGPLYLIAHKLYVNALWPENPIMKRHRRAGVSREQSGYVETLAAAAVMCRTDEFASVGMLDERATIYWEEQELARKFRRRGQRAYYRADAFVFHRWRKGGGEHDDQPTTTRYFEEGMELYYSLSYGPLGRLSYRTLGLLGALGASLRALARGGSRPASR